MQPLPHEFLALCRQLGAAQRRCSAVVSAQAAQIQALQAQVVQLRGQLIVRDTRLAVAQDELAQLKAAHPGLPPRKAMARHISTLAERLAALSRECLRWRLAAQSKAAPARLEQATGRADMAGSVASPAPCSRAGGGAAGGSAADTPPACTLDAHLAAADLVICQTGCISHDDYWRVQDHCRRTGKPCILVDQPLAARTAQALAALQPMVVLRMADMQGQQGRASQEVKESENFDKTSL